MVISCLGLEGAAIEEESEHDRAVERARRLSSHSMGACSSRVGPSSNREPLLPNGEPGVQSQHFGAKLVANGCLLYTRYDADILAMRLLIICDIMY